MTHLSEMLAAADPPRFGFSKVIVVGGRHTLNHLKEQPWLVKATDRRIDANAASRVLWRQFRLTPWARNRADVLLIPGGSYLGTFRPFVAMAQNLLPFDSYERAREHISLKRLRLHLLESIQTSTFKRADGLIFMTDISRTQIEYRIGSPHPRSTVIHHGTSARFWRQAKQQLPRDSYDQLSRFRLLYVSILEPYKHQSLVLEAVAELNARGVPLRLDLIGPGHPGDQRAVKGLIAQLDPGNEFLAYHGALPYAEVSRAYEAADAFVFASSCETFGIILLEAMAAGLPVICSQRSAIPEVVGSAAKFFDPQDRRSLTKALLEAFNSQSLRRNLSFQSQEQARRFSWRNCADATFGYVREIYENHRRLAAT